MPNSEPSLEPDLDAQLRGLFVQAEQAIEERPSAPEPNAQRNSDDKALRAYMSLPQMLRPVVIGLESVMRAMGQNTALLSKLDHLTDDAMDARKAMPRLIAELQAVVEQRNGLNQRMFDAMHEELKGYKDNFLLEAVHKPVIRDLISLFDDLTEIHRQMHAVVVDADGAETAKQFSDRCHTLETNLRHNCEFITEVLARLEVAPLPDGVGKLDKRTQRAASLELTENAEEDNDVVRSVKRGFLWKGRVVRPEEVVMKKCKASVTPTPAQS